MARLCGVQRLHPRATTPEQGHNGDVDLRLWRRRSGVEGGREGGVATKLADAINDGEAGGGARQGSSSTGSEG
jgi:hypothetical protein